jgi:redox-sensitive bicupin YhaK (pirin superfamily)
MSKIQLIIRPRETDLGGFSVRRVLPFAKHRMVGPFLFFDHMGPAEFAPGTGMDVRPHPHIHLATITYLFEGAIHHRDSLGSSQWIEPGAVNWMIAGKGIVHSERTPAELRKSGGRLNGIQCWVALPEAHQETAPSFHHHPGEELPEFTVGEAKLKLLLGKAFGKTSPVKIHSDLFYLEARLPAGASLLLPSEGRECAVYVAEGEMEVEQEAVGAYSMAVAKAGEDLFIRAKENSRLMLLGGASVGERYLFWNFASSAKENLERAKAEWANGPGSARFPKVPEDEEEFIPLPSALPLG